MKYTLDDFEMKQIEEKIKYVNEHYIAVDLFGLYKSAELRGYDDILVERLEIANSGELTRETVFTKEMIDIVKDEDSGPFVEFNGKLYTIVYSFYNSAEELLYENEVNGWNCVHKINKIEGLQEQVALQLLTYEKNEEILNEKVKKFEKNLKEAEAFAKETGMSFSIYPAYGMGGRFEEGKWESSTASCI